MNTPADSIRAAMASPTELEHLGRALARLRRWRGLKQAEVARLTGLRRPHVSRVERGGRRLTIRLLNRFLRALDATPVHLVAALLAEHEPAMAALPPALRDSDDELMLGAFIAVLQLLALMGGFPGVRGEERDAVQNAQEDRGDSWPQEALESLVRLASGKGESS